MQIKTTADQIAEHIRNAIFGGNYLPGDRLKENEISTWLSVSRTPIREAFHKLEAEGLLEFVPNKGAIVPMLENKDIDEILELRLLIEVYCVRKFIRIATDATIQEMETILRRMENALKNKNIPNYFAVSLDFHDHIIRSCQNQRIYSLFKTIRNTMRMAQSFLGQSDSFYHHSMKEHLEIMRLLKERSPECARVIKEHIENACDRMRERLNVLYESEKMQESESI